MATDMVDFAMVDSSASASIDSAVETPTTEVETPTTDTAVVDIPVVEDSKDTTGKETESHKADGTERTPEEREKFKTDAAAKTASDKTLESTPANVRSALKAMRDSDPKNAAVVKELHGSYERWQAAKQVFPKGVAEMTEAKAFIDSVGGPEGYQKTVDMINQVTATDELLYAADSRIWDNVIEDLKANGHADALGALAPSFLDKLKSHDSEAYYNTTIPVVAGALEEVGMGKMLDAISAAMQEKNDKGEVVPNLTKVAGLVKGITDWYSDLGKDAKTRTATPTDTPERKKFLAEKAAFEKTKSDSVAGERKKVEEGIATECDKHNNVSLGKVLGGFLKLPFFKGWTTDHRETLVDLGNGIKDRLYTALKADKAYQTQMSAMWTQKTPDRAKILQYHQAKVDSIATDIVTKTVQSRYPGYAKGGSAAGKVAAAVEKKATSDKAAVQSVTSGKPIYVAAVQKTLCANLLKLVAGITLRPI